MSEWLTRLVIGIIGSVIITCLAFVSKVIWGRVVLPWWEDRTYVGEEIEGEWLGYADTPSGKSEQHVVVKRKGYRVWGTIETIAGTPRNMKYNFEGTYKSLLLTATYEVANRERLDRGSFTLMLSRGGKELVGGEAAHLTNDNRVGYFKYEWTRRDDG